LTIWFKYNKILKNPNLEGAPDTKRENKLNDKNIFIAIFSPMKSEGDFFMSKRLATLSLFIEDITMTEQVNQILHEFSEHIVGRMGIPYRERGISVISIIIDAESDIINKLSGKLGMVKGISAKTLFSKI
jgi:putative iron-only hydrogenase system regulator